jgi:adenine-specific DNA-methyltransferase
MSKQALIDNALHILVDLRLPPALWNARSALTLLSLVDLQPNSNWAELKSPLMGITPMMEWIATHYGKQYAPNRETIRRQTIYQFIDVGIALRNPDSAFRSASSPHTVYQISPACLVLLRTYGTELWRARSLAYLEQWRSGLRSGLL